ncbi:MAG: FAD-binding oxidoreductase [bacterium]|uniref:Putative dihydroorotate oxidase electron transfer subunit n=2 Tax=Bacteria candidate phyla TaxID=1783234 RepID=A0A101I0E1_UNCT6|nr:MAG: putative dihydroorotate oxidase electron transfer subunit [candidate division TA06 bacterium 32_111]KUK86315.1 MAG: putative dihydroorotate oxidase electron transfer subunit [candidate division TA06 bacterium 34_109]MDI6699857.1 FAD-binding oxidoreductase [bacterium]HCP17218.1 hypothetical protein [candidate division WOR-3 bacterium]
MIESVLKKIYLTENVFLLEISRSNRENILLGQFASIKTSLKDKILRRPFTIVKNDKNSLTFLIKVVGSSTENIGNLDKGDYVDILYPLGKGFEENLDYENTIFVGGGIGIAALIPFLKGKNYKLVFGDREGEYEEVLKYFSLKGLHCQEKKGRFKGYPTDFLNRFDFDTIVGCGPKEMLKSLKNYSVKKDKRFYAIYEEVMGCGIGLCNGCSVKMENGDFIKLCTEGPILDGKRIIYD